MTYRREGPPTFPWIQKGVGAFCNVQAAGENERKVRAVRLVLQRLARPLEVIEGPVDITPDRLCEFRQTGRAMRESALRFIAVRQADLEPLALKRLRPREDGPRLGGGGRGLTAWILGDSSRNSTIQEVPGSGWLAATPQTHRLRPWGFPMGHGSNPGFFR